LSNLGANWGGVAIKSYVFLPVTHHISETVYEIEGWLQWICYWTTYKKPLLLVT